MTLSAMIRAGSDLFSQFTCVVLVFWVLIVAVMNLLIWDLVNVLTHSAIWPIHQPA